MSKNQLKHGTKRCRVIAVPGKVLKNSKGEIVKQFYDIYKTAWVEQGRYLKKYITMSRNKPPPY